MRNTDRSPFRLDTDLISLRTLVAIADLGSFSAAACTTINTARPAPIRINRLIAHSIPSPADRSCRKGRRNRTQDPASPPSGAAFRLSPLGLIC